MENRRIAAPVEAHGHGFVLILTATVTPSAGVTVARNLPDVRRRDYLDALDFWLQHPDSRLNRIVFLENSGEDLGPLERLAAAANPYARDVEFISTTPYTIPPGLHYGWGELRMLDEGIARSRLLEQTSHFIKASGRFKFPEISALLDQVPCDCDAMVDSRIPTSALKKGINFISVLKAHRDAYASTQLMLFSLSFYREHLLGLYASMKSPYPSLIENLLFDKLASIQGPAKILLRFPVNCDPSGIGATNGISYDTILRKATSLVRGTLRKTSLWF
jgi:hypothetical protein